MSLLYLPLDELILLTLKSECNRLTKSRHQSSPMRICEFLQFQLPFIIDKSATLFSEERHNFTSVTLQGLDSQPNLHIYLYTYLSDQIFLFFGLIKCCLPVIMNSCSLRVSRFNQKGKKMFVKYWMQQKRVRQLVLTLLTLFTDLLVHVRCLEPHGQIRKVLNIGSLHKFFSKLDLDNQGEVYLQLVGDHFQKICIECSFHFKVQFQCQDKERKYGCAFLCFNYLGSIFHVITCVLICGL